MQGVVVASVLELLTDTTAHLEARVRRDRHIPAVEESMQVASQEEAILDAMGSARGIRLDVSCLQHRKSPLPRRGAPPLIRVGDEDTERSLAKVRQHQRRRSVARRLGLRSQGRLCRTDGALDRSVQRGARFPFYVVALPLNGVTRPFLRDADPRLPRVRAPLPVE